jgi:hypothetical protein
VSTVDVEDFYLGISRMDGYRPIFVRKTIPYSKVLVDAVKENKLKDVLAYFVEHPNHGDMKDEKGVPLLYFAIKNRAHDIARALLDNRANPDEIGSYEEDDSFPLHLAIRLNDVEMTQILLDYGANVNKVTFSDSHTPLALAVEANSPKLVATLCRFGAVVDQVFDLPLRTSKTGKTVFDLVKSKPILTILETTLKAGQQRTGNYKRILKTWQALIKEYGTVYIQSQKTGQCYSDSFQFILYYADGLNRFFIENAFQQEQLSEKEKRRLYPRNDLNVKKYLEKGNDLLELYMAYTGHRFLNMVKSKPMQIVGPSKTLKRRMSVSGRTITNTGVVCSTIINLYHLFQQGEEEFKVLSVEMDSKGNLTEDGSLMFWNGLLKKIPSQYGTGGVYTSETLPESQYDYVVGMQIVGSPADYRDNIGHAISIVKLFGSWYLCDDNIGFAQPIEITIAEIVHSTIGYNLRAGELTYFIIDEDKPESDESRIRDLFTYIPTDPLVNRSQSFGTMFEYERGGTITAGSRKLLSRKYITWDPRGRAATTKYEYAVISPPPRKIIKWKNGDAEFQEYEDVLKLQEFMNKMKLNAERRRREELGNVNNNAMPNGNSNAEGGARKTRRKRKNSTTR